MMLHLSRLVSACDQPYIVGCFLDLEFLKVMLGIGALLGVHLVEPFLILTISTATSYSCFSTAYYDLLKIEPCKLLNLNKAAFTFFSDSQFTHFRCALKICRSIEAICEEYKPQVLKILKVILPVLAEAFQRQKGEIFGFGSYNENTHSLSQWIKIS